MRDGALKGSLSFPEDLLPADTQAFSGRTKKLYSLLGHTDLKRHWFIQPHSRQQAFECYVWSNQRECKGLYFKEQCLKSDTGKPISSTVERMMDGTCRYGRMQEFMDESPVNKVFINN